MEYGSDFHFIDGFIIEHSNFLSLYRNIELYACGRHPIIDICNQSEYKRLWVPQYFCYDVISSIQNFGINIQFYVDYPNNDDNLCIESLNFEEGDALLRVNYFGLRYFRSNINIPIPVIEDHTHAPTSYWALNSDADWCVASLRKTFPLATGGMLWSPKGFKLRIKPTFQLESSSLYKRRFNAMQKKNEFLNGRLLDKNKFLSDYRLSEKMFYDLPLSKMETKDYEYFLHFNYVDWFLQKKYNWNLLNSLTLKNNTILQPEIVEYNSMFSLIILFKSNFLRNIARDTLIKNRIYPAILWETPEYVDSNVKKFSDIMLSIHCDGRYNNSKIIELKKLIEILINNN